MSRPTPSSDPTLTEASQPTPFVDEAELAARVRSAQDSEALTTLINRHTGIYLNVVKNYAATYPGVIRLDELSDDKFYNIYQFVLSYRPDRSTKLSTYIHDMTDYLCKGLLKEDRKNPLASATFSSSGAMILDETAGEGDPSARGIILSDETDSGRVEETANRDLGLQEILEIASSPEAHIDARFLPILRYRHFNAIDDTTTNRTSLTWREIGEKLNLSHERVRGIYQDNIARVRRKLREPAR